MMAVPKDDTNSRKKLSEQARDVLREKIVYDDFEFGRVLRESELSLMLGMSKSPVREALVELSNEGLVVMFANRSARVMTLDSDDATALGELRGLLECEGIRLAIERDPVALTAALEAVTERGQAALEEEDVEAFVRADHAFHLEIFRHCGNAYLLQTFERVAPRIQAMRSRLARNRDRLRVSQEKHIAIVASIRTGASDTAVELVKAHIRENVTAYCEFVHQGRAPVEPRRIAIAEMERFAHEVLTAADADRETAVAIVRALSHASSLGVDTHGYRLLPHYLQAMMKGRVNPRPKLTFVRETGAVAVLDGDDGHGARATYAAVARAVDLAAASGIGAVAIRASSHFGAAGAYAAAIAREGMVGLCVCNSDAFVRLHGGAERFHGTNPIAFAAPAEEGADPWLLDMATSAIPFNKILLSRSLQIDLPEGTASDERGRDTISANAAEMLAPLGAAFGYKGAGLAGISEILSAALSDAPLSREIAPMISDEMDKPRGLGAFVLAIDPDAFMGRATFRAVVARYRELIRGSDAASGRAVMAAGDREWAEVARRQEFGITLDPSAVEALAAFAVAHGIAPLDDPPTVG
jgi:LDH2 family malate/lactate/ureidoglycolate dehydrogenase/DNA-binding GntR family transcriptional regulator